MCYVQIVIGTGIIKISPSNIYPGSLTGKHHHAVIMYQVENTGPTPVPGALIF